ncbi:hypothetical protein PGT21_030793 [Puccinia graminis f. sp. tritici]|uniref:Hydrophobin n=2 Tax=Puccinia graminis f. sp. tritici TaxID=56615 RepID=E3KU21_PUCGT|nr:uncharacterized protein PGTG_14511 [Puccinia graminis f. sp. tritici CRL 75-36-700-3]KAA1096803.1 hypothetical protein PGT21_029116 [Puccinia graminis f. sp. tritici]EFP87796.1 hypothetical protein PGTG_14511 [Puccinia graminis f. sp. tritici CRL 75-36-700-3]KAA1108060.1 hypothetical protein PGTUg99_027272 [Puccinia graminis f. sp. tritici]KAA1113406.1 hypothetical protein PGT21_030793 [Puccinia graminis f. sp. tritici]KAA1122833.1 hypothetical protein PGTUg99_008294 [Puccinia graminis f. s
MKFWQPFVFLAVTRGVFSLSADGKHRLEARATSGGLPQVNDQSCSAGLAHYCFIKADVPKPGGSGSESIVQIYIEPDANGAPKPCEGTDAKTVSCCNQSKFKVLRKAMPPAKGIFITPESFKGGCPKDK